MEEICPTDFKTSYSYLNPDCVVLSERHDQWNRTENPEIDSHKYIQLIVDKGAKVAFSTKGASKGKTKILTKVSFLIETLSQNRSQS